MAEYSFLLDAAIYLLATVVFVPVAARLGLGSVIGYLLAGCMIGPFGLGLIRDVEAIFHFAEFGVVLMLFVIGLELELDRLWQLRRSVFAGGALQMAGCGAVLAGALFVAGLPMPAAALAALSLALSSTAVAMQTLTERGILASPTGRVAFGVLLFQDLAAIPIIAVVPLLAATPSTGSGSVGLGAVKVATAVLAVIGLGRLVVLPVLRAIARLHQRDVFTAFALLVVITTALLMQLAGVSMALGAFLAGVLLASSEYRHALETDIEPFRGLLMGLFFVAVGMSIDFALLGSRSGTVLALVIGYTALKLAALWALAGPIGVPKDGRPMFAAVLSQGSEFAFVVFGVAGVAQVLPGQWNELLTLVVALSMLLTPLVVLATERVQRLFRPPPRPADRIERTEGRVIIVGFGRFGQIVGRLLFASGVRATVLDHDPDNIELLRRLGFRVFYGDGTRLDLLTSAGAASADVLIDAIDEEGSSLKLVDVVQQYFPELPIVARARNVTHWRELRERGLVRIERETFESALRAGRHAFETLGVRPFEARERADAFRRHNVAGLEELLPQWADETARLSTARNSRLQFEQQFQRDLAELEEEVGQWHRAEAE
jgi:glutathione-regulated potassium-efflux system ancillary protein KefC